ncbi:hypothetical protein CVT25_013012, partial [Psilocybe cyanescens]
MDACHVLTTLGEHGGSDCFVHLRQRFCVCSSSTTMTSKLLGSVIRGTLNFIMPASPSIDEHSVLANETGTTSVHEQSQQKNFKSETTKLGGGKDADSASSLTVTGKRMIEEGERSSKQRMTTRKVVDGTGA